MESRIVFSWTTMGRRYFGQNSGSSRQRLDNSISISTTTRHISACTTCVRYRDDGIWLFLTILPSASLHTEPASSASPCIKCMNNIIIIFVYIYLLCQLNHTSYPSSAVIKLSSLDAVHSLKPSSATPKSTSTSLEKLPLIAGLFSLFESLAAVL